MHYHDATIAAVAAAIAAKESNMSAVTEADNQNDAERDVDVNDFLELVAAGNTDPDDLAISAHRLLAKRRPPKTVEEYVAAMGLRCPSCDSTDTRVDWTYPEIGGVESRVHCDTCGARWCEWYELKGYGDLTR